MGEYCFRLSRLGGELYLERFQHCFTDEHALAVARTMLAPINNQLRVEVWRGEDCIYDGIPASWPVRRSKVAATNSPHASRDEENEQPPRAR